MVRFLWTRSMKIGYFRVHLTLHFKARQSAELWKPFFIHIEIGTNYHNKHFALRLALNERLIGPRKWPIVLFHQYSGDETILWQISQDGINSHTSESPSLAVSHGLDWGWLCASLRNFGSSTACIPPPGIGSFRRVGVLCWELVALFVELAPVEISGLPVEEDLDSTAAERTGMRDWLLVSETESLRSTKKVYSVIFQTT